MGCLGGGGENGNREREIFSLGKGLRRIKRAKNLLVESFKGEVVSVRVLVCVCA